MCDMIEAIMEKGGYITVENPSRSLLFKAPRFAELVSKYRLEFVYLDQCCYGLRSPVGTFPREIWKKGTYFVGNFRHLSLAQRVCTGGHQHTKIFGSIRVRGKHMARSALAGRYPGPLCRAFAGIGEQTWQEDGWRQPAAKPPAHAA